MPAGGRLEQSDGTSWMAMYCLNLLEIALVLAEVNYLLVEALRRFARYFGPDLTVAHAGRQMTLAEVADELSRRLVSVFLDDDAGRRPVFGDIERFQTDPALHGMISFHEYSHGDTGKGLGASHQTGWTGLVADLIARRPNA